MQSLVRKTLQRYWRFSRGLTMGAQAMVFDDNGAVLLVRHTYRPGWHFPGGGVERNQTADAAVRRELLEEAGVIVDGKPRLVGVFANFAAFPSDHVTLFEVSDWRQPEVPPPNREIAEQGFFAVDALPDGTRDAVYRRLAERAGQAEQSLDW